MPMTMSTPIPLYFETEGDDRRPALLMINPLGTTLAVWDPMMEQLEKHHFVIRFDLRGHGRSVGDPANYRVEDVAHDALAVLDALEVPRSHVFGAGFGGLVAITLAADHPDRVDRLVVASTGLHLGPDDWWKRAAESIETGGMAAVVDELQDDVRFSERWLEGGDGRGELSREMFLATPEGAFLAGIDAVLNADVSETTTRVRASTLVIFGEKDPILTYFPATDLIDRIADAEGVQVGGAAHFVIVEHAGVIGSLVDDFLTDPDGH